MKGYPVPAGYMGLVNGSWMLFATESDYYDYMKQRNPKAWPVVRSAGQVGAGSSFIIARSFEFVNPVKLLNEIGKILSALSAYETY